MLCLIIVMHPPGIEPGAPAWKANMLPLHHGCFNVSRPGIEPGFFRPQRNVITTIRSQL